MLVSYYHNKYFFIKEVVTMMTKTQTSIYVSKHIHAWHDFDVQ